MHESASVQQGPVMWTPEDINLLSPGGSPGETLVNTARLVQNRFKTEVCSVYLLEPSARERRSRAHAPQ
jgi:hypothetical protein